MANMLSALSGLFNKTSKVQPTTAVPTTPAVTTSAPTQQTPDYLQSALSSSGQYDANALQQRASQAIKNQVAPDTTASVSAAQQFTNALPKGAKAEKALANIAVSDYQNKLQAYDQQSKNWAMATQTKTEGTQQYLSEIQSLQTKAQTSWDNSIAAWNKGSQMGDQYLKDANTDMARITSQIQALTERYSKEPVSALAGSIVSGVAGFLEANKGNERAIAERYGTASQEMQDYQTSKRVTIGTMVGDLTSKAWDRVQSIRNTGIQALTQAGTTLATNTNWIRQKNVDFQQALASSQDAMTLNMGAYMAGLSGMKSTALGEFADWLDQSPVALPEATPMMQQLMELYDSYQARQLASKELDIQDSLASTAASQAAPTAKSPGYITSGVPSTYTL